VEERQGKQGEKLNETGKLASQEEGGNSEVGINKISVEPIPPTKPKTPQNQNRCEKEAIIINNGR